jgi:MFS family permease
LFAIFIRSFGRPMFVFLLFVMMLLATTELGTDGWIQDIMKSVLKDGKMATMFFIYTSTIMFVLRFFAGPIVHKISPLGLLAVCAGIATCGLLWLGNAGNNWKILLMASTLYAFGKTFFWPTTLGVVSEQYPRGGALLLNAISGVGMIAVGTIGGPAIGSLQDVTLNQAVQQQMPAVHASITHDAKGTFFNYQAIDPAAAAKLTAEQAAELATIQTSTKQRALAYIAVLPAIMLVCYLVLIAYFKSRGGYKAQVLTGHAATDEKFTGGTEGPGEA